MKNALSDGGKQISRYFVRRVQQKRAEAEDAGELRRNMRHVDFPAADVPRRKEKRGKIRVRDGFPGERAVLVRPGPGVRHPLRRPEPDVRGRRRSGTPRAARSPLLPRSTSFSNRFLFCFSFSLFSSNAC